ncbi:MAG TPA: erythromycin esterase family protein [Verrucomicrobiae bacterium]|jgi:erythromycin esterase-like protein
MAVIDQAIPAIQESLWPWSGARADYDPLLRLIGDARYVLLGEATHGTHEFYKSRAEITKRLIAEKEFTVIAWEADWPDALRASRYVRGESGEATAVGALDGFKRFPTWMWRNADILDLVGWLRDYNSHLPANASKVGIYGLDLYSLHTSMDAVIRYLDKADPEAAHAARRRYACFEDFGDDPQSYGMTAGVHESLSCEDEVVEQLVELQRHSADYLSRDGRIAADELFFTEQNARVARNAEHYYRAMYHGRPNTWNLRDTHMADTLDELMRHLEAQGENPKAVIWAHNSHLGDARATQMGERGELNVGQLVRERHGREAISVGFTTYTGTVTAASDWDAPAECKRVRPGMDDSYEQLFHQAGAPNFLLPLRGNKRLASAFARERLERAIGVIYRPDTERWSHYFHARLAAQFDAVIHFDETRAVEPLERTLEWNEGELLETFPTGL